MPIGEIGQVNPGGVGIQQLGKLGLAPCEFRQPGAGMRRIELAKHVTGSLSVADEQQLHASSFALPASLDDHKQKAPGPMGARRRRRTFT